MSNAMTRQSETAAIRFERTVMTVARIAAEAMPTTIPEEDLKRSYDRIGHALKRAGSGDSKLYLCDIESVATAVVDCAMVGLVPGGQLPDMYLIPRKEKGVWKLNAQISYRGLQVLGTRHTNCLFGTHLVWAEDEFAEAVTPLGPTFRHVPKRGQERSWDTLIGGYVAAAYLDGRTSYVFCEKEDILLRRDTSDAWRSWTRKSEAEKQKAIAGNWAPPWYTWWKEMARKTVIIYAIRRGVVVIDEARQPDFSHVITMDNREYSTIGQVAPQQLPATPQAQLPMSGRDGLEAVLESVDEAAAPQYREDVPMEEVASALSEALKRGGEGHVEAVGVERLINPEEIWQLGESDGHWGSP